MKKIYAFVISFISIASFAQNESALLYKISGNGITQPSYIFGTIHISCDAKLEPSAIKALDATSQMYLELDMDDPDLQKNMLKLMNMRNGTTISSLISKEDYEILDSFVMAKMNVSLSLFNSYKPFLLNSMFLTTLLECKPQYIENELVRISTQQKEPVFGLETVVDQMSIFDLIPYQLQAEELVKSIKANFKDDKIELDLLLKAYAKKDLNKMQQLFSASSNKIMIDYEDLLLKNRNNIWVPKIERISKEKPTFFGVGAAHLLGDDGLISLLRRAGYQVEAQ